MLVFRNILVEEEEEELPVQDPLPIGILVCQSLVELCWAYWSPATD